jgi:hypothetical protein
MQISASQGSSGLTSDDATLSLTFTSSESTSNFDANDVTCVGGEISDFSGSGTTYTATFTPSGGDGEKTISVPEGSFTDESGNLNVDSESSEGWILVLRHDSREGYFSNNNVRLIFSPTHSKILKYHRSNTSLKQQDWAEAKRSNPNDPTSGKYSILDEVETIGKQSDGTYVIFERKVRGHHS